MTAPLIKICGISDAAALDIAIAERADYAGLVFFAPSPRNLSFPDAAALAQRSGAAISRVGVFVDPADDLLREAVEAGRLGALQVHRVTAARRAEIRARFGLPVWAVVEVSQPADLTARAHLEAADRVIYDAKTPAGSALPGGMGLAFDWTMLSGMSQPAPWGLAGGLSPANVAEAVRITGAPLVDASSGLESAPGVKDPDRIRAFIAAARGA
ncbi:phosphoribosylanthranilate isomerase [Altererythrobacter sp. TH136]|uniref:phosphoribosylanthranilate isomerase n=1 Tax=Altererythrobacter sp. TH136 TaxID=2067415 RepID=UPI00116396C3|nr:phosphoribosylanthranilate isomerase [Altererythrobacter sp. TH136]QDM40290.1 phosphoribosylanthranilate isomerase [Altererythrobacter sp. TH136]